MDWSQILVIILAICLAIFLILAIVLTVLLIKVTKEIKSVAGTAAKTADNFEKAAAGLKAAATPVQIMKLIVKFLKKSKHVGSKK